MQFIQVTFGIYSHSPVIYWQLPSGSIVSVSTVTGVIVT